MTFPIAYPFPTLTYTPNPSFFQMGQATVISPVPGTGGSNFAIASGSLPAGLTLNPTTGVISGTPTALVVSNVVISDTLPDTTVLTCSLIITITDIPTVAPVSNTTSATDLVALMNFYEKNFVAATTQMIANNQQLGMYWVDVDLPLRANPKTMRAYFEALGYQFYAVNWRDYQTNYDYFWGTGDFFNRGYYGQGWGLLNPGYGRNKPGYPCAPVNKPRIRISWFGNPVICVKTYEIDEP